MHIFHLFILLLYRRKYLHPCISSNLYAPCTKIDKFYDNKHNQGHELFSLFFFLVLIRCNLWGLIFWPFIWVLKMSRRKGEKIIWKNRNLGKSKYQFLNKLKKKCIKICVCISIRIGLGGLKWNKQYKIKKTGTWATDGRVAEQKIITRQDRLGVVFFLLGNKNGTFYRVVLICFCFIFVMHCVTFTILFILY